MNNRKSQGKKKSNRILNDFMPYIFKYRLKFAAAMVCSVVGIVCELYFPVIVRFLSNLAISETDKFTMKLIMSVGVFYLFLRIADAIANYFRNYIGGILGAGIERDMRRDLFCHLQSLSNAYFDETKIGQLMSRFTSDISELSKFVYTCPEEMLIAFCKILFPFAVLSIIEFRLTLIIFSIIPIMAYCMVRANHRMRDTVREAKKQLGELNSRVEDNLLGIRVIKSFTNEEMEKCKFEACNNKYFMIRKKICAMMAKFFSYTRVYEGAMYLTTVVAGAFSLKANRITPADYTAFLLYISILLSAIRRILDFTQEFQQGLAGMDRFFEIIKIKSEIKEDPNAVELYAVKGAIDFRNVCFRYPSSKSNVLNNINLQVMEGENIAIVGTSGGGKSTLCSLIPRFYDVNSGCICLDGIDIRRFTIASLRQQIGIVMQDVYLFSGTVKENIEYGQPGASMEEIILAAKKAGAHDFIMKLDNGYDTYVGERGVKLSGGQKQRLSIARVFLKNPRILILDEATSALDNESEQLIQKSLEELSLGRTTFTIAHRLTTIKNASRILVMSKNGIEEEGNHEQLMSNKGLYYSLYCINHAVE